MFYIYLNYILLLKHQDSVNSSFNVKQLFKCCLLSAYDILEIILGIGDAVGRQNFKEHTF